MVTMSYLFRQAVRRQVDLDPTCRGRYKAKCDQQSLKTSRTKSKEMQMWINTWRRRANSLWVTHRRARNSNTDLQAETGQSHLASATQPSQQCWFGLYCIQGCASTQPKMQRDPAKAHERACPKKHCREPDRSRAQRSPESIAIQSIANHGLNLANQLCFKSHRLLSNQLRCW